MNIEEINTYKYDREYDSFCYQNCIKLILAANGIKKPNFYINMTLSFWLRDEEKTIHIFDDNARSVLPEFQEMVQRVQYDNEEGIARRVWEENLRLIQAGEFIIVGVDSFYLEYLPYYMNSHGRHTVIVTGFDEKSQMVDIIDWFAPWFFIGQVPLQQFLEARGSMNDFDGGIYSGNPIYNNWARVTRFNGDKDYKKLIITQLKMSYEQYFLDHSNDNEYNGRYATIQLQKILGSLEARLTKEEKIDFLKELHAKLYTANRRRDFFSLFVKGAYEEIQTDKMRLLLDKSKIFYEIWEKFIYRIIKSYMKYKEGDMYKLINILDQIISFELEYESILKEVLNDF